MMFSKRVRSLNTHEEAKAIQAILRDFPWLFAVKSVWDFDGYTGRLRVSKDLTPLREVLKLASSDKSGISLWVQWTQSSQFLEARGILRESSKFGGVGVTKIKAYDNSSWAQCLLVPCFDRRQVRHVVCHIETSAATYDWYTIYRADKTGLVSMVQEVAQLSRVAS